MYSPYNEKICKNCPFAGKTHKTKAGISDVQFIDCQRDNKDAQEHFMQTSNNESLLLWIRQSKFLNCLYAGDV